MKNRMQIALTIIALATPWVTPPYPGAAKERASSTQSLAPDQTPLTAEKIHDLISRTIDNQHRDDAALDSFERVEHLVTRTGGANGTSADEKTYRVVPTGSGTLKLLLGENGAPVPPTLYRRQLRDWEGVLEVAVHADDPREVAVVAKQQKRRKEEARFVDAVPRAYQITWLGREMRDGRIVEKLQLEPNPNYQPHGDATDWLTHARATVRIDPLAAQVVSIDATIIRDISIGGGILGKIYHGGRFHMDQAPAAPDVWEPTLYQYDISGRKFLFISTIHEARFSTHYVLRSGPEEALEEVRNDLAHCCTMASDP